MMESEPRVVGDTRGILIERDQRIDATVSIDVTRRGDIRVTAALPAAPDRGIEIPLDEPSREALREALEQGE